MFYWCLHKHNSIMATAAGLIFFTIWRCFSPPSAFWHSAVHILHSNSVGSIHLCLQQKVPIWWYHIMVLCVMEMAIFYSGYLDHWGALNSSCFLMGWTADKEVLYPLGGQDTIVSFWYGMHGYTSQIFCKKIHKLVYILKHHLIEQLQLLSSHPREYFLLRAISPGLINFYVLYVCFAFILSMPTLILDIWPRNYM